MSEDDDKRGVDLDLDELNWDDALAEWEDDLDGQARAESAPMPQHSEPPPAPGQAAPPPRPLYRPPTKPPPARPGVPGHTPEYNVNLELGVEDDEMFEEDEEATRIGDIPPELLAELSGEHGLDALAPDPSAHDKPTRPPPASDDVDLDLDGLLDNLTAESSGEIGTGGTEDRAGNPADPFGGLLPVEDEEDNLAPTVPRSDKAREIELEAPTVPRADQPAADLELDLDDAEPLSVPPPEAEIAPPGPASDAGAPTGDEAKAKAETAPPAPPAPVAKKPAPPGPSKTGGYKPPPPPPPPSPGGRKPAGFKPPPPGRKSLAGLRKAPAGAGAPPKPPTPVAPPKPVAPPEPATGPTASPERAPVIPPGDAEATAKVEPSPTDVAAARPRGAPVIPPGDAEATARIEPSPTDVDASKSAEQTKPPAAPSTSDVTEDSFVAELSPPSEPPAAAAEVEADAPPRPVTSSAPPGDEGAQAARRTVKYRKPRREHFPLMGRSHEALEARRELLQELAKGSSGSTRAGLLVAAAEVCEQLGQADEARALYEAAREADPRDPIVLRALRRDAMMRGEHTAAAALLQTESSLALSADDRASALMLHAELCLRQLGDATAAERSARTALGMRRSSVAAALLLAECSWALGKEPEAIAALERAADAWPDAEGVAALRIEVGRALERQGNVKRALACYETAVEASPGAFDGWIGVARCARAEGDLRRSMDAILRAAALLGEGPAAEALRRQAARIAHVALEDPQAALSHLDGARGIMSLRARAEAAAAAGDREAEVEAVEAWAAASGETERALALVTLAELRAGAGDLDAADSALRDAALADSNLGLVQVVREVLARRAGDSSRLARVATSTEEGPGASLIAAARVARDRGAADRERELLARAVGEGEAPVTADVLSLDAGAGDDAAVDEGLRRGAERAAPEQKVGPLLLLADRAAAQGDIEAAVGRLEEAREVSPGDAVVLRPLGRLLASTDARAAAAVWLEEASAATGERAAFAATQAGRLLVAAGADPSTAYRRALDVSAGYAPAAWALEPRLRDGEDFQALAELHERLAELVDGSLETAGRLIRAALLRAADDPSAAAALLDKARSESPDDAILYELMLRLGDGMAAGDRAALLAQSAENAPPDLARSARLRAAAAYEMAGDHTQAAALYREVLAETDDGDPIALRAIDRAEIAAGEHPRVADRRFAAVKDASDDESKVNALERMADFDLFERDEASSAVLSLQSILEVAPGHLPSLRTLERRYMDEGRDEDLVGVEEKLTSHVAPGPDVAAHARLCARLLLRPEDAAGDAADGILLTAADRAAMDLWLARRVVGAAGASRDGVLLANAHRRMVELIEEPRERLAAALRAADALEDTGDVPEAAQLLGSAFEAASDYPIAGETLGKLRETADDATGAAEAYETAASAARVPRRAADLWYRAAVLWQDRVGDEDRAMKALTEASELAPTYLDVFDRLKRILIGRGSKRELAELTERRIHEGGEPQVQVQLHLTLAQMREELGEITAAKESLRAALALEPERVEALRQLADLSLQDEDWRGAAEALIKIARLRKDRDELRWVFFTLGDIYDHHMPDPRRAEAAYNRVLKLIPEDTEAMERLAQLYQREGNTNAAADMLHKLAQHEVDPDRNRDYQLRLATSLENQGDARQAEAVLEQTRRKSPTDLAVIRALAEFYQRQNAQSALSMHLNRAVADYRHALARDPSDASLWPGLVEVLDWRGLSDAARCCASAAYSLGVTDIEMSRHVDPQGGIPGAGGAVTADELEDMIAPPQLTRATRAVFRMAGDALEKALPFDLKAFRADRLPREHSFKNAMLEVGRWFGAPDIQLYQTYQAPRVCVAIGAHPVTVLVGGELFTLTDEREKLFLLARAVKVARANLAVAVRSQPAHLAVALAGLIRSYDPRYTAPGIDPNQVDDMARRVAKHVHRKHRDDLFPLVMEMAGTQGFDPTRLGLLASELGDRVALVATGSMPASIESLLKLAGSAGVGHQPPSTRVAAIRQVPEAASLLEWGISDGCFEIRRRAGADRL